MAAQASRVRPYLAKYLWEALEGLLGPPAHATALDAATEAANQAAVPVAADAPAGAGGAGAAMENDDASSDENDEEADKGQGAEAGGDGESMGMGADGGAEGGDDGAASVGADGGVLDDLPADLYPEPLRRQLTVGMSSTSTER